MWFWLPLPDHPMVGIEPNVPVALYHFPFRGPGSSTHLPDEKFKAQRIQVAPQGHTARKGLNWGPCGPFSDSIGNTNSKGQSVVALHLLILMLVILMIQVWDLTPLSRIGEASHHVLLVHSIVPPKYYASP